MKRGDIYYIARRDTVGAETMKARPAVIVSNDKLNATSEVVEVVYLTTQPKKEMNTHAVIKATGVTSTALCEHIDHVSILLVGDYCGRCTAEEMAAIDAALLASLGLTRPKEQIAVNPADEKVAEIVIEYAKACAERDAYKGILDKLLTEWGGVNDD